MLKGLHIKKVLILGIVLFGLNLFAREFNMVSNINLNIPVETYQKMGIKTVWIHCSLPVELDKSGTPVWKKNKDSKLIKSVYDKFKNSGISVFLAAGIWRKTFEGQNNAKQKSIYGKDWIYGSFSASTKNIEKKLKFLVRELMKYKCFGGICIDDEPAVIVGGCFNAETVKLFKAKYNLDPPSLKDFTDVPPGIIRAGNIVLLWMKFQKELIHNFYRKLLLAVREVNPTCPVYTIPAASWIAGKTISKPGWTPQMNKMKRIGCLDLVYVKNFHLFNQYCFSILDENGWDQVIADGLCQYRFSPPEYPRSIVPIYDRDPDEKGISPHAFQRYVLQTFAEGARGIGYWPASVFSKNIIITAEKIYKNTIKPLCEATPNMKKLKGEVAVLISTSTIDFGGLWNNNPIERFLHIHESEALEYYLFKRGIPFDVVLENEVKDLSGYKIILAVGIKYFRSDKAKILTEYVAHGGQLLFDKSTGIDIKGATKLDYNARYWYDALRGQSQRASDLEYQCGVLDGTLNKYIPDSLAVCRSSSRHANINYLTDDKNNIYLFIVNNDLNERVRTLLSFNRKCEIEDILTHKVYSVTDGFQLDLKVGDLKVFRLR